MRHGQALLLLCTLTGCTDHLLGKAIGAGDSGEAGGAFPTEISDIWSSRSCTNAGCHGGGSTSAGVGLEPSDCDSVVAGGFVVAGDASGSMLWIEVNEESMPLSGDPLTQDEKDAVAAWINDGASCGATDSGL